MTPTTATIHVICVGDELLRGDTTNTNLADLGQLLERHGLAVADEQCVPDDHDAILRALRHAAHDAANTRDGEPESAVILVGGLGPTPTCWTRSPSSPRAPTSSPTPTAPRPDSPSEPPEPSSPASPDRPGSASPWPSSPSSPS